MRLILASEGETKQFEEKLKRKKKAKKKNKQSNLFPFPCSETQSSLRGYGADSAQLLNVGLWQVDAEERRGQRCLLLSLCGCVIFW